MPDLLLELFSEEIPARMQRKAADDLKKLITDGLVAAGLTYDGARGFATPRRLALSVSGIPARSPDTHEEKKGPRVGAPEGAIQGFLKAAGLTSIDQAEVVSDGKKGDFYVARLHRPGRPAIEVIADLVPQVVRTFPWPKSQRWGTGSLRWVRPLHSILCTFGPETEEPEIVPFEVDGIRSGNVTRGHRFLSPDAFTVRRFEDYAARLQAAHVVLDTDRRKDIILHDARDLAFASGLELVEDEGLLEEVAGLVEWPVVLMGSFEERFLDVPGEVIRATIRANQKCFVLRRADGSMANRFLLVSNVIPSDGGAAITHGNGRVVRARLSDAHYFWETDQKDLPGYGGRGLKPLDQRMQKIRDLGIVFHEKLGTQGERVDRIVQLAETIATGIGADPALAGRAAGLAKADLVSEVVGEFPEVQGLMGRRYAELQGEAAEVAAAIEDHYKPQGPSDRVPRDPVSIAVALADKLDTLVGFWAIDEKPTGSKDPYALRRAALGVIRLVLDNQLRVKLRQYFLDALTHFARVATSPSGVDDTDHPGQGRNRLADDLLAFFHDRLKVQLRDLGVRHDLVDAVIGMEGADDLMLVVRRVEALAAFLASEDGASLLAGYNRAANILKAEEKKSAERFDGPVEAALLAEPAEQALAAAIAATVPSASAAVEREDFAAAMTALAGLRGPVDAFFETILVNAPEAELRRNRLTLLTQIRAACHAVADFSRIG